MLNILHFVLATPWIPLSHQSGPSPNLRHGNPGNPGAIPHLPNPREVARNNKPLISTKSKKETKDKIYR
jgi:hypothetical protein